MKIWHFNFRTSDGLVLIRKRVKPFSWISNKQAKFYLRGGQSTRVTVNICQCRNSGFPCWYGQIRCWRNNQYRKSALIFHKFIRPLLKIASTFLSQGLRSGLYLNARLLWYHPPRVLLFVTVTRLLGETAPSSWECMKREWKS